MIQSDALLEPLKEAENSEGGRNPKVGPPSVPYFVKKVGQL